MKGQLKVHSMSILQVSFREVLPSESHRRQQQTASHHRPKAMSLLQVRSQHDSSDLDDRASSPSLVGGSRAGTPSMSEASVFSPHGVGTEDSFFHFTSRMVHMYVKEEEVRARHQATLLQLRLKALQEKTKVCNMCVFVCACTCVCVCVYARIGVPRLCMNMYVISVCIMWYTWYY